LTVHDSLDPVHTKDTVPTGFVNGFTSKPAIVVHVHTIVHVKLANIPNNLAKSEDPLPKQLNTTTANIIGVIFMLTLTLLIFLLILLLFMLMFLQFPIHTFNHIP